MRQILSFIITLLSVGCSQSHQIHLAGVLYAPGALQGLTWGSALTFDAGVPQLILDGGAGSYPTDPIILGGNLSVQESGASLVCQVPAGGAASGSINAQLSNDQMLWFAAGTTAALIDGGIGDGGVPAALIIPPTAAPYARVLLTTVAAINATIGCTAVTVPQ